MSLSPSVLHTRIVFVGKEVVDLSQNMNSAAFQHFKRLNANRRFLWDRSLGLSFLLSRKSHF